MRTNFNKRVICSIDIANTELRLVPIVLLAMDLGTLGTMIGGMINNQEIGIGYLSDQNIEQEINQILKDGIQEKVDRARLLIVTNDD